VGAGVGPRVVGAGQDLVCLEKRGWRKLRRWWTDGATRCPVVSKVGGRFQRGLLEVFLARQLLHKLHHLARRAHYVVVVRFHGIVIVVLLSDHNNVPPPPHVHTWAVLHAHAHAQHGGGGEEGRE